MKKLYRGMNQTELESVFKNAMLVCLVRSDGLSITIHYLTGETETYNCSSGSDLYNDVERMFFFPYSKFKNIVLTSTADKRIVVFKDNLKKIDPTNSAKIYLRFDCYNKNEELIYDLYGSTNAAINLVFVHNIPFKFEEIEQNEYLRRLFVSYLIRRKKDCSVVSEGRKNVIKKNRITLQRIEMAIKKLSPEEQLLIELEEYDDIY